MIFGKVGFGKIEQFLAVNLFPKSASFATFTIDEGVKVENFTFVNFGENENLANTLGKYLTTYKLREGTRVVFGLPFFWIEGEKVKPEFERLLLATAEDLKLTPMAFVSSTAALGFYKYRKDPNLTKFYILQIFEQKILAEKFERGEVVRSEIFDFENLDSFDFLQVFPKFEDFHSLFVFSEKNLVEFINSMTSFFNTQNIEPPKILEVEKIDFAHSLATATAFDLGKLPEEPDFGQEVDFGFVKDKDVGRIENFEKRLDLGKSLQELEEKKITSISQNFFSNFFQTLGNFKLKKLILAIIIFVLFLTAAVAAFWFLPASSVEIFVKASPFSESFEIKAVPQATSVDEVSQIIPAQTLTTTKEGNKKTVTSGKKLIGEKAQGVVIVFNKTTAPKTFSPGTVIIGPSDLKFILTESVTIASRSASLEGITYGKNKVRVESAEIGETGNLSKGTDFAFANFDSLLYSAHSEEAFTGGFQKEVNVVAAEDRKRLEEELTKELRESAKSELTEKAFEKKIEDGAILPKVEKLQFDKDIEVEANILSLQARINFTVTVFLESDIQKIISAKVKNELPPGFTTWQNEKLTTKITKIENDGTVRINAEFTADLIPEIRQEEIARAIAGKSADSAKNHLLSLPEVQSVNIVITPKLPNFLGLGNLPRSKTRIKVAVIGKRD